MAFDLARVAVQAGNHPFGAVLVHNGDVIAEAVNTVTTDEDETAHAEMNLIRAALNQFAETYLRECTLFASTEPCAMCAGAIYISGIGRVVYGLPGARLAEITEWAYATDCRTVFAAGSQPVEVVGPLLVDEAEDVHRGAWGGWGDREIGFSGAPQGRR